MILSFVKPSIEIHVKNDTPLRELYMNYTFVHRDLGNLSEKQLHDDVN